MKTLNTAKAQEAETIIFGELLNKKYDIYYFEKLSIEQLDKLIEKDLIDLEETQNYSPTVGEFKEFMTMFSQVKAHGYIVNPSRSDSRITIEGLICNENITEELLIQFSNSFHSADEFEVSKKCLRVWWD